MKIKDIRLYGFKSFSGETKCLLNPGITAFVGPNGSGKSNIFDALRWVFGEQSMKALRCEKNEDLIHISPELADETNFTEVGIIIDNEDFFPQFGSEFEIKRRFYRTGESEFFLNRVKCRLQDIQALFLNSGTLTYSFLELAEIEKIIQGDTKEMFDDVSGILRYQERRDQTNRRLEQTEQDLMRLEDVIGEMERGIRSLRRQARQTQMYQELREEYKNVSLAIAKSEYNKILHGIQEAQEKKTTKATEKQSVLQALNKLEEERKKLKDALAHIETERKEYLAQISSLKEHVGELETNLAQAEEKTKELLIASERLAVSAREKQELLAANRRRIIEHENSVTNIDEELNKAESEVNEMQTNLERTASGYFNLQETIRKKDEEISELKAIIELDKDEIAKLESNQLNKKSIIDRISAELDITEKELDIRLARKKEWEEELEQVIAEQDKITAVLAEAQQNLKTREAELADLETEIEKRQSAYNELRITIDTLVHRLGQPEGIKEIKHKFGQRIISLLRDNLEVTSGYESVVDVCLGDILNFYLLSQFELTDIQALPEGKTGLINVSLTLPDREKPQELGRLKTLVDIVKFRHGYENIGVYLQRYFIAENLDRALQLAAQYADYGFVTRDGVLFENGKIVVQKGEIGFFKINQALQENRAKLETMKNQVIFTQDEKKRVAGDIDEIKTSIERERAKLLNLNIKKSETSLHISEVIQRVADFTSDKAHLVEERNTLIRDTEMIDKHVRDFVGKKDTAGVEIVRTVKEKEELNLEIKELGKIIDERNAALNRVILQSSILKERKTSMVKTIESLLKDNEEIEKDIAVIQENKAAKELAGMQERISLTRKELEIKRQARAELEFTAPDRIIEDITRKQEAIYENLTQQQKHLEETQNEMMKIDYESFQLNYRKDELVKKAQDEFITDLIAYAPEEIPEIEKKQAEIRDRLEKLGEVNPLSLQAYEQEKKRLDEFLAQRNDIIAAKQSLLKSIEELDQRARDRFVSTFAEVKEKFNQVFANFFEGGEADLILTDPTTPLTSDVQIVVRMKGKRVKTINQLSGGERTLLAVSLLLAFYLVKPAPFCILDEIDAPLDDANVVRFNRFLRDLSQRTQVVIITHNRATMEYADYLYGLTMEKLGQSKIVSVKLADLEKLDAVEIA